MKLILCIAFQVSLIAFPAVGAHAQRVSDPVENPEMLVNLARLDADAGRLDKAISNYERSVEIIDGPLPPGVDGATATQWAKLNLGFLYAAKGVDFFQANNLDDAIASFRTSLAWNPYSRDIRYSLCQALYIQASRLKDQGRTDGELAPLYRDIVREATRAIAISATRAARPRYSHKTRTCHSRSTTFGWTTGPRRRGFPAS
jgi:tetratricopeptide (TPR) repeat protein